MNNPNGYAVLRGKRLKSLAAVWMTRRLTVRRLQCFQKSFANLFGSGGYKRIGGDLDEKLSKRTVV